MPLYGSDIALRTGDVRVGSIPGRSGHYLQTALQDILGAPTSTAGLRLEVDSTTRIRNILVGTNDEVLRYELTLEAVYIMKKDTEQASQAEGIVSVVTAYDAAVSPYASYAARRDRTRTAAIEAARLIVSDIYLQLAKAAN